MYYVGTLHCSSQNQVMSSANTIERNAKVLASWPAFWKSLNADTKGPTKLHHPMTGKQVDHISNVTRPGHDTLIHYFALWLAAIPDLPAEVLHVHATEEGGWLVYRGEGTHENDLASI